MVAEKERRRSGFQGGAWIRMADGQEWLFTSPPPPGVDARYDALIQDRVRTIIAESDPDKLGGGSEPGLETLRRQVKYQLDEYGLPAPMLSPYLLLPFHPLLEQ